MSRRQRLTVRSTLVTILLAVFLLTASCSTPATPVETRHFEAIIREVDERALTVDTQGTVEFSIAVVHLPESLRLNFMPAEGQRVNIEILPEIRESYPVQVTAVQLTLLELPSPSVCESVSVGEAENLMRQFPDFVMIDVRSEAEFERGHVEGAVRVTVEEFEQRPEGILQDPEQVVFVYCASGVRSRRFCRHLQELGFQRLFDLGGRNDWTRDPRP